MKKIFKNLSFSHAFLLVFICFILNLAEAAKLDVFAEPSQKSALPKEQYVEVEVHRLKKSKVLWVNWDLLQEYDIEFPKKGLTPQFQKQVLDLFAWAVPSATDPAGVFTSEVKTLFAEYYGGRGRGLNLGSGRAASYLGKIPVQAKGSGKTSLVRQKTNDHSNGAMSLEEAMREAIWGEISAKQLPYGANRVLFILDRGTTSEYSKGELDRDAIVIRQDPIRPAHFMNLDEVQDKISLTKIRTTLAAALGAKPNSLRSTEGLKSALTPYIQKIAAQYARAFVGLKYFHGATSPSNIELNGQFLDYGTQTAQPGHGKIQILDFLPPAGDTSDFKNTLIQDFVIETAQRLQLTLFKSDLSELKNIFDNEYEHRYNFEFLSLLGWPEPIALKLANTSDGKKLAKKLSTLATQNTEPYIGKFIKNESLIAPKFPFANFVENLLTGSVNQEPKINALFLSLQNIAIAEAAKAGITEIALKNFMLASSRLKNQDSPELYRWRMIQEDRARVEQYLIEKDAKIIQQSIDSRIYKNLKYLNSKNPWQLIISEKSTSEGKEQTIFDAQTNKLRTNSTIPSSLQVDRLQSTEQTQMKVYSCTKLF